MNLYLTPWSFIVSPLYFSLCLTTYSFCIIQTCFQLETFPIWLETFLIRLKMFPIWFKMFSIQLETFPNWLETNVDLIILCCCHRITTPVTIAILANTTVPLPGTIWHLKRFRHSFFSLKPMILLLKPSILSLKPSILSLKQSFLSIPLFTSSPNCTIIDRNCKKVLTTSKLNVTPLIANSECCRKTKKGPDPPPGSMRLNFFF